MSIFLETLKMVLKVFSTNKMRTFLTMLGIIIGIFSITIIFAVSEGTKNKLEEEFKQMDQATIEVSFNDVYDRNGNVAQKTVAPYFALEDLAKKSKNIEIVSVYSETRWKEENKKIQEKEQEEATIMPTQEQHEYVEGSEPIRISEVGYRYFEIKDKTLDKLMAGRFFTAFDEKNKANFTIINSNMARDNFGGVKNAINRTILINNMEYKVIGVMESSGKDNGPWDEAYVYPAYVLHNATGISSVANTNEGKQNKYIVKLKSSEVRAQAKQEIKDKLRDYVSSEQYYVQMGYGGNQEATNSIMNAITMVFAGIAGLSLLVGGIGIMNIMLVSVNERIREIGIRQALGAKRIHIIMQFLIESIMLTLFAGILGMAFAEIAVFFINAQNYGIELVINVKVMFMVTLFCGMVGIIFGFYPANKASKLNIADALRYE